MTWEDWIERHGTLFGMQADREVGMLTSWANLFAKEGYTPCEAWDSSQAMALNDPPEYRSDQLRRLAADLRRKRPQKPRRDAIGGSGGSWADCALCEGTGWLSVPSLRPVLEGTWRGETGAVTCTCSRGAAESDRLAGTDYRRPMGLAEYARRFPGWREALAEWHARREARLRAEGGARELDGLVGRILTKARAQVRRGLLPDGRDGR